MRLVSGFGKARTTSSAKEGGCVRLAWRMARTASQARKGNPCLVGRTSSAERAGDVTHSANALIFKLESLTLVLHVTIMYLSFTVPASRHHRPQLRRGHVAGDPGLPQAGELPRHRHVVQAALGRPQAQEQRRRQRRRTGKSGRYSSDL